jgi:hypothetical protein
MKAYINVTRVKGECYVNCDKFILEGMFWTGYRIILKTFITVGNINYYK